MDYLRIYNNIIQNGLNCNRNKKENYFEEHHITPKSLGGSNSNDNLVLLTAKEHYICHLLLVKIYYNTENYIKMLRAFMMMKVENCNQLRYTSKMYELKKLECYGENGLLNGNNAPFYGKNHSEDVKNSIRIRQKENNSMKNKIPWNKGLTSETDERIKKYGEKQSSTKNGNVVVTEETRLKISNKTKGVPKKPFTEEHKSNISKSLTGKTLPEDVKLAISLATKNVPKEKTQCPYCGKIGGNGSMQRWHFENCKRK